MIGPEPPCMTCRYLEKPKIEEGEQGFRCQYYPEEIPDKIFVGRGKCCHFDDETFAQL